MLPLPPAMPHAPRTDGAAHATAAELTALMDARAGRGGATAGAESSARDACLADCLRRLLDPEVLSLVRVQRHTPAPMLARIVQYEAVHPVQGRRDLDRRLADDRRCYAFVHPALPDEPLIFTELALTTRLSSTVGRLLDPESPVQDARDARCAVLYSISSGHPGLKGVPLGNALIVRVASEISRVFPRLDTVATLSPVPGFGAWLAGVAPPDGLAARAAAARAALSQPGWFDNHRRSSDLRRQLLPLCAHYLLNVRRRGEPQDAVARFHLRNGARLERINWLGDASPTALRQSAGMMVNYLYRTRRAGAAYDAWTSPVGHCASRQVRELANGSVAATRSDYLAAGKALAR